MGNRNRPIGPSTVPGRAHCPSGGRHNAIFNIRCVQQDMPVLYERVDESNILSRFVVGRPGPEYGLPVAVI